MRLSTGCGPLDTILGGGVESGAITLVIGEAGTGKTNFCLQLSRQAVLKGAGKVAFVDTEGVSMERLTQIAGPETDRIVKDILFFGPQTLEEQARTIKSIDKIPPPSLIVVDSLNMYYRLGLTDGAEQMSATLTTMLGDLLRFSRVLDVPAVVTGQVYASDDGVQAFGGRIMEHIVKTILRLERLAPGIRRATLLKHRSQAEGQAAEFSITQTGLAPLTSR